MCGFERIILFLCLTDKWRKEMQITSGDRISLNETVFFSFYEFNCVENSTNCDSQKGIHSFDLFFPPEQSQCWQVCLIFLHTYFIVTSASHCVNFLLVIYMRTIVMLHIFHFIYSAKLHNKTENKC